MRIRDKIKRAMSGGREDKHAVKAKRARSELSSRWRPDKDYKVGELVRYRGKLYICTLNNTSVANISPDLDTSQWSPVLDAEHHTVTSETLEDGRDVETLHGGGTYDDVNPE